MNLQKTIAFAEGNLEDEGSVFLKRTQRLLQMIEDAPKSTGWQLRARVGTSRQWYTTPEWALPRDSGGEEWEKGANNAENFTGYQRRGGGDWILRMWRRWAGADKAADALWHLAISQKAASAQNFYYTQLELQEASNNFGQAQNELNDINIIIESLLKITPQVNEQYLAAQKIINIGKKLTESAAILTNTIDSLQINNINGLENLNLTERLTKLTTTLNQVAPMIKEAKNDLQKINSETLPLEYQNQIFIAEHGSWNRNDPIGYRITMVKLENNRPVKYEVFAEGWFQSSDAWGRPVDIEIMPDGALLVSDDRAGVIYRISYTKANDYCAPLSCHLIGNGNTS